MNELYIEDSNGLKPYAIGDYKDDRFEAKTVAIGDNAQAKEMQIVIGDNVDTNNPKDSIVIELDGGWTLFIGRELFGNDIGLHKRLGY
jgi:hypothetical protein